jgi:hypothetical protein
MTIIEVYEKYKHLDKVLCDSAFVDSMQSQLRYDMWQAIRAAGQGESAPTTTNTGSPKCCRTCALLFGCLDSIDSAETLECFRPVATLRAGA